MNWNEAPRVGRVYPDGEIVVTTFSPHQVCITFNPKSGSFSVQEPGSAIINNPNNQQPIGGA